MSNTPIIIALGINLLAVPFGLAAIWVAQLLRDMAAIIIDMARTLLDDRIEDADPWKDRG